MARLSKEWLERYQKLSDKHVATLIICGEHTCMYSFLRVLSHNGEELFALIY